MAYTPELTYYHSRILRRIAWAAKLPMTKAMAEIFDYLGATLKRIPICNACKDRSWCRDCPFGRKERWQ
ncbi:MAG: hypothetical protein MI892_04235 [Desulfobacterales bacterium]|nr:hypothetical protein [Desulfobacterales bacterium]